MFKKKKKTYGICDRCGSIREFRRYRGRWECQNCKATFNTIMRVDAEVMNQGDSPKYY
jgi:ribosomal protein L37AE/L43A